MHKGNEYFLHSFENESCLPRQKKNTASEEFELLMSFGPKTKKTLLDNVVLYGLKIWGIYNA